MNRSICGYDCKKCELNQSCGGCTAANGCPFSGGCVIAMCCKDRSQEHCSECPDTICKLREQLIQEFNLLGIEDMEEVTELNALKGSFINVEYMLPGGQNAKFWDDDKIYLGSQLRKKGSDRCYGIAADEKYLMVCEYGEGGADAEIVLFRRRS